MISETPFFSSYFQDGLVEYYSTLDPCTVWFQFTGPEYDFDGFQVISEEKLAKETKESLMLTLLDTLQKTWEKCENDFRKDNPVTLH